MCIFDELLRGHGVLLGLLNGVELLPGLIDGRGQDAFGVFEALLELLDAVVLLVDFVLEQLHLFVNFALIGCHLHRFFQRGVFLNQ